MTPTKKGSSSTAVQLLVDVLPIVDTRKRSTIPFYNILENVAQASLPSGAAPFFYETVHASLQAVKDSLDFSLRICRKGLADTFGFSNRGPLIPVLLILFADIGPECYSFE